MSRTKLIAANWKMYKTPEQTREFFHEFLPLVAGHDRDEIVVCPPDIDLAAALHATKESKVAIGAQNVHWKSEGAFTGETSTGMLLALGGTHVIIGHSERRQYFCETDDTVNLRLKAALEAGLAPICCGARYWKSVKPGRPTTFCGGSACGRFMQFQLRKPPGWWWPTSRCGRLAPARRLLRSWRLRRMP